MSATTASTTETLYVFLVGEGVDVWRPVEAIPLGDGYYQLPANPDPEDECWEFAGGSTVVAELRNVGGDTRLVAVAQAAPPRPRAARR